MNPYYQDDALTLYRGDAYAIVPTLRADLVLTDPDVRTPPPIPQGCKTIGLIVCADNRDTFTPVVVGMERVATLVAVAPEFRYLACDVYGEYDGRGQARIFSHQPDVRKVHPGQKPLQVIEWFLSLLPGEVVCDPFAGSMTTLVAARNLGRKAIGVEIDSQWCELTTERLAA